MSAATRRLVVVGYYLFSILEDCARAAAGPISTIWECAEKKKRKKTRSSQERPAQPAGHVIGSTFHSA